MRIIDLSSDVCFSDLQTEFGRVLDFAFDDRADRVGVRKGAPGVRLGLLEAERNAALVAIDFEDDDVDFLAGRDDLAGVDVILDPRHLADVNQAFDAGFEFDKRAVIGDVSDGARELRAEEHTYELQSLMRKSYAGFC